MKIHKIKLIKNGLKGMRVTYLKTDKKDNVGWKNEYNVTYRYPVLGPLAKAIRELELDFGLINGLVPFNETPNDYTHVAIQSLKTTEENFCIEASVETMPGCFTTFKTPVINSESGYERYRKCMDKVEQILNLVEEYVEGDQKMDANEIVKQFSKDDLEFDMEEFKTLSAEEKRIVAINMLEEAGCIVIQPEEEVKMTKVA